jgi:hypothetical protein
MEYGGLRAKLHRATLDIAELLDLPPVPVRYRTTHTPQQSIIRGSIASLGFDREGPVVRCRKDTSRRAMGHEVTHAYHICSNQSVRRANDLANSSIAGVTDAAGHGVQDERFLRNVVRWVNARSDAAICNEAMGYGYNAYLRRRNGRVYKPHIRFSAASPGQEHVCPSPIIDEVYITIEEAAAAAHEDGLPGIEALAGATMNNAYRIGMLYGEQLSSDIRREPALGIWHGKEVTVSLVYPARPMSEIIGMLRANVRMDAHELVAEAISQAQRQFDLIAKMRIPYNK